MTGGTGNSAPDPATLQATERNRHERSMADVFGSVSRIRRNVARMVLAYAGAERRRIDRETLGIVRAGMQHSPRHPVLTVRFYSLPSKEGRR